MPLCVVKTCINSTKNKIADVSFHKFPKGRDEIWKKAINQPNLKVSKYHVVCSAHFKESDYLLQYKNRKRLKDDAIPSVSIPKVSWKRKLEDVFDEAIPTTSAKESLPGDISPLISLQSTTSDESETRNNYDAELMPGPSAPPKRRKKNVLSLSGSSSHSSDSSQIRRANFVKFFHNYSSSPSQRRKQLFKRSQQIKKYKNILHNTRQKLQRLKRNVQNLKQVVDVLRRSNQISTDASTMLENSFSGIPLIMMKRMLSNIKSGKNVRKKYPQELRNFAMTLQFYSPKAYDFVRRSFNLCLPAPSVIRSWLSKIDCEPGYSKPSLDCLTNLVKETKESDGREIICALMFDEMSIRKQVQFEGGEMKIRGYVDFGAGPTDDTTLATEALVVMIVCVNGSWKLPIAYFLINKLNATEKASIVKESLQILYNIGITIISVTCDGPQVNLAMAKHLGCKLSNEKEMQTWFPHPSDNSKVYLFLDVCHMLKLVRNNWAKLKKIVNVNNEIIDWNFIELLFITQENEGLKLANKLSKAHIEWKSSVMKVNLAAQVLSSSVANALKFMKEDIKDPRFEEAGATIEFLHIINNLFDILNSRNPFGRAYKTPMREANESYWLPFMQTSINYLWNLKTLNGVPLHRTLNKTPILGFIISSLSAVCIYEQYVKGDSLLKYVLTYKFSQDHLELFFCSVRSRNGWNNNPSCLEFIKTYKRLLVHQDMKNFKGNCIPQDSTNILTKPTHSAIDSGESMALGISTVTSFRNDAEDARYSLPDDDPIDIPEIRLSCLAENVVAYIGGFVVRQLVKKLKCETCIKAISGNNPNLQQLQLIQLKTHGGLIIPSPSVLKVCLIIEKQIRTLFLLYDNHPPPQDTLLRTLKSKIGTSLLQDKHLFSDLEEHVFDTTFGETLHRSELINEIIAKYAKIRLHSLVKQFNLRIKGAAVRKQLNKLILFKHQ